jgi:chemotaxis protein MotB
MAEDEQPIVVKKIVQGHGHHGGAWKVAFADFATAMMAFFMLMWLLGFADDVQKGAIADYFQNPSGVQGPGGASTSMIDFGGAQSTPRFERPNDRATTVGGEDQYGLDDQINDEAAAQDEARMETLLQTLQEAIGKSQALEPYKDHLLLDITPEGLRIQIVDRQNRAMFDVGSARLKSYTEGILNEIAEVINNNVPNQVSIAGHTDARQYNRTDYTNWELSADRANSARRALKRGGMDPERVSRVVGLADSVLFMPTEPFAAINRRISIVVMYQQVEAGISQETGVTSSLRERLEQLRDARQSAGEPESAQPTDI